MKKKQLLSTIFAFATAMSLCGGMNVSVFAEEDVQIEESVIDCKSAEDEIQLESDSSIIASGQCGANCTYTLYNSGLVIISGSGNMYNYEGDDSPFYYDSRIKSIQVNSGVTSIGAFFGCSSLASVTIPDSVTSIDIAAFYGCGSLTSVEIPDSVTSIGDYAFCECSKLMSVTISDSVTSISEGLFYGCSNLVSVTIPDSVTSIKEDAFYGCDGLTIYCYKDSYAQEYATENSIPFVIIEDIDESGQCGESCTYTLDAKGLLTISGTGAINPSAFSYTNIKQVVIEKGVTSIGEGAFYGCSSLTSVEIPDSVKSISDYTFCECSSLTSVKIPDSVTSIGNYIFYECSSLTSVTIPDSVTSIGIGMFCNCSSLTSVEVPDSVTIIDAGAFFGCSGLTSVNIPDKVESIGVAAFCECSSLTSVEIPDSVMIIDEGAFYGCSSLTSMEIPDSVTSIGDHVFSGCSSMNCIKFYGDCPTISSTAFDEVTTTVYYPEGNSTWEGKLENYGGTITWTAYSKSEIKPGPVYENGKWVLYDENLKQYTGSGTPVIDGKKYYVQEGELKSGWLHLSNWQMYFYPDTFAAATGIVEVPNKEGVVKAYMFDQNGVEILKSRTEVIDGKKYWFQPDGSLMSGWCTLGQWKMYYDPETYVGATGLTEIDGKYYMFNSDGVLTKEYPGLVGPQYEDNKWVLYDEDGNKVTKNGTPVVAGNKYYVQNGKLESGWLQLKDWQMYFYPDTFAAAIGIVEVPNKEGEVKAYMFDQNGVEVLKSRTEVIDGKKYWFQPDGSLKTGWCNLGQWRMYFFPDTYYAATGTVTIDGEQYTFNEDGVLISQG